MSRDLISLPPIAAEARIRYGEAPSQFFGVWCAKGAAGGVAVMIHGGFWRAKYDLAHASHLCAALAESGVSVANLEYRRVGETGGGWPGSLEDVKRGVAAAREYFGALPVVVGHSAGGHLALRLAAEDENIKAVVALAPVAVLQLAAELNLSNGAVVEFLGCELSKVQVLLDAACPSLQPSTIPRILVHGAADDVVPISLSRKFAELRRTDVGKISLVEIAGANHFDLIDPESSAWPTVCDCVLHSIRTGYPSAATNRSTKR
jgi:acetyl esterase/lipase